MLFLLDALMAFLVFDSSWLNLSGLLLGLGNMLCIIKCEAGKVITRESCLKWVEYINSAAADSDD